MRGDGGFPVARVDRHFRDAVTRTVVVVPYYAVTEAQDIHAGIVRRD